MNSGDTQQQLNNLSRNLKKILGQLACLYFPADQELRKAINAYLPPGPVPPKPPDHMRRRRRPPGSPFGRSPGRRSSPPAADAQPQPSLEMFLLQKQLERAGSDDERAAIQAKIDEQKEQEEKAHEALPSQGSRFRRPGSLPSRESGDSESDDRRRTFPPSRPAGTFRPRFSHQEDQEDNDDSANDSDEDDTPRFFRRVSPPQRSEDEDEDTRRSGSESSRSFPSRFGERRPPSRPSPFSRPTNDNADNEESGRETSSRFSRHSSPPGDSSQRRPFPRREARFNPFALSRLERQLENARSDEEREYIQQQIDDMKAAQERQQQAQREAEAHYQDALERYEQEMGVFEASDEVIDAHVRYTTALTELEEMGFITREPASGDIAVAPDIREAARELLTPKERQHTYHTIGAYFREKPPENPRDIQSVQDIQRSVEVFFALVNTGEQSRALELYQNNLSFILMHRLRTYDVIIDMMQSFFDKDKNELPGIRDTGAQNYILGEITTACLNIGDARLALDYLPPSFKLAIVMDEPDSLTARLARYARATWRAHRLAEAEYALKFTLEMTRASGNALAEASTHLDLMEFYIDTEQWKRAEEHHQHFMRALPRRNRDRWLARGELGLAAIQRAKGEDFISTLDRAEYYATYGNHSVALSRLLVWRAELAWENAQPEKALAYCQQAVQNAQTDYSTLHSFLALAHLHLEQPALAREHIEKAAVESNPSIHLLLNAATVFLALEEPDRAAGYVRRAYLDAWGDGPPYCHPSLLARARELFKQLDMAEPELFPFEQKMMKLLPHEAEIRQYIEQLRP